MDAITERSTCPLGCPARDKLVLIGRDRLHNIPGEFRVVRCGECGLMRTEPRPTLAAIGNYYPAEYAPYQDTQIQVNSPKMAVRPSWKVNARRILNKDSKMLPAIRPGRLLEIGCASGAYLHHMAGLGWQVEGIEFSQTSADAARRLGYKVFSGTIEAVEDRFECYDLIVGWMVFEHLHNPTLVLEKAHEWVRPGGWLVISVPDAGSLEFKIFKHRWYALDLPRHLYHYTLKSLGNLLRCSGWEIDHVFWQNNANNLVQSLRYVCIDRDWPNIATYLLDIFEGRRHRYLHLFMGKLLGTLHASGRMTVWAKRT